MNASEMISHLEKLIAKYGDRPICMVHSLHPCELSDVNFRMVGQAAGYIGIESRGSYTLYPEKVAIREPFYPYGKERC